MHYIGVDVNVLLSCLGIILLAVMICVNKASVAHEQTYRKIDRNGNLKGYGRSWECTNCGKQIESKSEVIRHFQHGHNKN